MSHAERYPVNVNEASPACVVELFIEAVNERGVSLVALSGFTSDRALLASLFALDAVAPGFYLHVEELRVCGAEVLVQARLLGVRPAVQGRLVPAKVDLHVGMQLSLRDGVIDRHAWQVNPAELRLQTGLTYLPMRKERLGG